MKAAIGDHLHFHGRVVGTHDRVAVILETRGADGGPPFRVRYDNGHETVVFPGADAWVEHADADLASKGPDRA